MNINRADALALLAKQQAKLGIKQPPTVAQRMSDAPAKYARHTPGVMNRVEQKYASHLDQMKAAGVVADWKFESVRLRLAKRLTYVPDFVVWFVGGRVECHECKGAKGSRYFCTDKGKAKVKMAGEVFLLPVCIVWPLKGGGWGREDFGKLAT